MDLDFNYRTGIKPSPYLAKTSFQSGWTVKTDAESPTTENFYVKSFHMHLATGLRATRWYRPARAKAPILKTGSLAKWKKSLRKSLLPRQSVAGAEVEWFATKYKKVFNKSHRENTLCSQYPHPYPTKAWCKYISEQSSQLSTTKAIFWSTMCKGLQDEQFVRMVNSAEWVSVLFLVPEPPPEMW